jgi:hypothetical protein
MTAIETIVRQVRSDLATEVAGPRGVKDAPRVKDAPSIKDAPSVRRVVC